MLSPQRDAFNRESLVSKASKRRIKWVLEAYNDLDTVLGSVDPMRLLVWGTAGMANFMEAAIATVVEAPDHLSFDQTSVMSRCDFAIAAALLRPEDRTFFDLLVRTRNEICHDPLRDVTAQDAMKLSNAIARDLRDPKVFVEGLWRKPEACLRACLATMRQHVVNSMVAKLKESLWSEEATREIRRAEHRDTDMVRGVSRRVHNRLRDFETLERRRTPPAGAR